MSHVLPRSSDERAREHGSAQSANGPTKEGSNGVMNAERVSQTRGEEEEERCVGPLTFRAAAVAASLAASAAFHSQVSKYIHCPPSGHFAAFVNNFLRVPLVYPGSREAT